MLKVQNNLYVKWTEEKGYGVFSDKPIKKGELVETCYCIKTGSPKNQASDELMDYVFNYPQKVNIGEGAVHVLPLGFGCIYNHDDNSNVEWHDNPNIPYHFDFVAFRDINAHDEICSYYGKDYWPQKKQRNEEK